jgi:hypothetical protein
LYNIFIFQFTILINSIKALEWLTVFFRKSIFFIQTNLLLIGFKPWLPKTFTSFWLNSQIRIPAFIIQRANIWLWLNWTLMSLSLFQCTILSLFVFLSFLISQSVCLSVCLFVCIFVCLFICFFVCLLVCIFVCLFVLLFHCLSICLFKCLFVCLRVGRSICITIGLSVIIYVYVL